LSKESAAIPPPFRENEAVFSNFISLSNHVFVTILSHLSDAIDSPNVGKLENSRHSNKPKKTVLTMHRYPKEIGPNNLGHTTHTDIGSLTLVLTEQWGLQVLMPETKTWCFVEPRPGLAVINVGDALRFMSGKRFQSASHRVVQVARQELPRYSICYFLRPDNNVEFKDMNGRPISAEQWHDNKQIMYQESHGSQVETRVITGGMECELSE
jgi:isopenicillin N synthase-like dioxygenase